MKAERQEKLLKEIQDLKRRLSVIERKAEAWHKPNSSTVRSAIQKKYPHVRIDPRLLRLVGNDPPLSLGEEKQEMRNAIANRLARK